MTALPWVEHCGRRDQKYETEDEPGLPLRILCADRWFVLYQSGLPNPLSLDICWRAPPISLPHIPVVYYTCDP